MSHFYGTLKGNHNQVTRQGTKVSGMLAIAASLKGCIRVYLYINWKGQDCYKIEQDHWQGAGIRKILAEGIVGE